MITTLTLLALAATPIDDQPLRARMDELHSMIWRRFVHPEVQLIFDYIPPLGQQDRWGHLPTRPEVDSQRPNAAGWGTGMEDCAITNGGYIGMLVDRYEITRLPRHADEARFIYRGLRKLAHASPRKGFVARCVLPDGKTHYANSSVDQYTFYVYGLWRYFRSSIATEKEKQEIRTILGDIAARVEDDGFTLYASDGKPALVSDLEVIRSDRASRLLEIFLVAHDVTGNPRWSELYRELLAQNRHARLRELVTPSRVEVMPWKSRFAVFALLQSQASLVPLVELERDLPVKAMYLEAMRLNARLVEERLLAFRDFHAESYHDDYRIGEWRQGKPVRPPRLNREFREVRDPLEAMVTMLMARERHLVEPREGTADRQYAAFLRDTLRTMLATYDFDKVRTFALIYAEMAYWLAVKQGLLTRG